MVERVSRQWRRHGRRCSWILISEARRWWCPKLERWITTDERRVLDPECRLGISNWRVCKTATAAHRAARGLALCGGGELVRYCVAFDHRLGRQARRETVWHIPAHAS